MPTDSPHDRALLAAVHPGDWRNPAPADRYNLVVLGGGTGGLVSAAVAAGLGAKVALVERAWLGGDCLNTGCVPSKALIHAGRLATDAQRAAALARPEREAPRPDFGVAMERMRAIRARIAPNDSAARFRDLGVDVFLGEGRFVARDALEVGGARLRFARAVVATGGRAAAPPIPGLAEAGFLTNESVFDLTAPPARLAVIGGGPIGCELAQTFARLGVQVTVFEMGAHLLEREDADAAAIVQRALVRDGVRLVLGAKVLGVARDGDARAIRWADGGAGESVAHADAILVAAGRAPNVEGIGLERAGVAFERSGIQVDDRLRTTNPNVYAVGDCCMAEKFTHAADAAAKIAVQNAFFFGRKKLSALVMPWCTYTDPELAHVGLSPRDAEARGIALDTYTQSFEHVDRALTDGAEDGFVRVHVRRGTDRVVGATVVAPHAGEMLSLLTAAITNGVGLGKLAGTIFPYPTQSEAIKAVANQYMRTRLTPTVKRLFETWMRWRR
ncbi:MAG: FAD-containing oxidoreductase [Proteobacteria bacterium]|nr:MAG: FAD-containing oxidoreductase [Pseudomonadota bacterium]